ncbi:MAG: extracellular solute-binding protein [Patescibacteria group bacterium]
MSKFQIVVFGIFIAAVAGGLTLFALYKGGTKDTTYNVKIWGTLDGGMVSDYLKIAQASSNEEFTFTYRQLRPETMYQNYVESLVSGTGPDILLLPHDMVWLFKSKITQIPYDSYPEKEFKTTFIQEGELYLDSTGVLALPFAVDPMVMYWNRDIFTNALISTPPKYWEDFLALPLELTKKDAATNIIQSAVGLGEYTNITHAKETLSLLMMQAGNPITVKNNGNLRATLTTAASSNALSPANSALSFYTQFANPIKQVYSWNRSLPDAKTYFTSNRLAVYFGLASEFREISIRNPNLNYDVAVIPQRKPQTGVAANNMTYGKMSGLSIARSTRNPAATMKAMRLLTSAKLIPTWVKQTTLPSVRRDSLGIDASKAESNIFATSALISRGWLDPDYKKSAIIFKDMIESVTSNRMGVENAIQQAHGEMVDSISAVK